MRSRNVDDDDKKYSSLNGLRKEFELKKTILYEKYETSFEETVSLLEHKEDDINANSSKSGSRNQSRGSEIVAETVPSKGVACFVCNKKGNRMANCFYNLKFKSYKRSLKPSPEIVANLRKRKLVQADAKKDSGSGHECEFTFMTSKADGIKTKWFLDSCASLLQRQELHDQLSSAFQY